MKRTLTLVAFLTAGLLCGATEKRPWSHLAFQDDPQDFRFAIVPDRSGGDYRGAFTNALRCCNLMHPAFVMTVGDLINGHVNEPRTRAMQDELTNFVSQVKAPFFYVIGNHDITCNTDTNRPNDRTKHDMTTRVWKEYFGERTYYSFTYKGCLFVALNGQDGRVDWNHIRCDITPEQYAWLRKTLAEHRDARWTFIFMHQPDIWSSAAWKKLERDSLLTRKYTVFAGDWHDYMHVRRYERDYYVLSVAGGCGSESYRRREADHSKLYGLEYGEFDHITWVTMTAEGPEVVNLKLDGILRGDFLDVTNLKSRHARVRDLDIPSRKFVPIRTVPHELDCLLKSGHIQGVACSEEAVYLSHQLGIDMIGWDGRLIRHIDAPAHLGDIAYVDGKVYGAFVLRGLRRGEKPGLVKVWNAKLEPIAERRFKEALDGITVLDGTIYVGVDRWGGEPHPLCCVKRLDLDLNDLGNTDVDLGYRIKFGVQTMSTTGRDLIFGNYGGTSVVSADLKTSRRVSFGCSEGLDRVPQSVARCDAPVFLRVSALGGNMQGWRADPTNNPPRIELNFWVYENGAFRSATSAPVSRQAIPPADKSGVCGACPR